MDELPLTDDELEALGREGWFRRARFLGPALAEAAAHALRQRQAAGGLRPAGVGATGQRHGARGDLATWLDPAEAEPPWPAVVAGFQALRGALNRGAYLGLRGLELQGACYPPGASYQRHLDVVRGRPGRRVTALWYLNPDWTEADGGQLRLHLAVPVEVWPALDSLVVFLSERLEHEVSPARRPRLAVTCWYRGP